MSSSKDQHQPKSTSTVVRSPKHCLFCRQMISNILHVSCIEPCCPNFDMCLHCFSLGIPIENHLPTHRYKIVENTDTPVFTDDWRAAEELLLLEAIERCGIGNWADISAYVGKSEQQCEEHYFSIYIFSQYAPMPDLTLPYPYTAKVKLIDYQRTLKQQYALAQQQILDASLRVYHDENGKPRAYQAPNTIIATNDLPVLLPPTTLQELEIDLSDLTFYTHPTTSVLHPNAAQNNLAEYKTFVSGDGQPLIGVVKGTDFDPNIMTDADLPLCGSSSTTTAAASSYNIWANGDAALHTTTNTPPRVLNLSAVDYYEKWYRCRLRQAHFEKPSETARWKYQQMEYRAQMKNNLALAVGYSPHRNDYDVEYLNDAEKDLCEMEFRPDDSLIEKEMKLRVLELYNQILDERIERKEFIDRYQLLLKRDKRLTKEEQYVYKALRPFARYLEAEEFDELVRSVVVERALRLRIEQLQTYRLNGIQTLQDGLQFDHEYAEMMKDWQEKYKKKYLDMSHIPIGQNEALKQVLADLDRTIEEELSRVHEDFDHPPPAPGAIEQEKAREAAKSAQTSAAFNNPFMTDAIRSDGTINPFAFTNNNNTTTTTNTNTTTTNNKKDTKNNKKNNNNTTTTTPNDPNNTDTPFTANSRLPKAQVPALFSANLQAAMNNPNKRGYEVHIPLDQQKVKLQQQCPCMLAQLASTHISAKQAPPRINNPATTCTFDVKQYPHASMLSTSEQLLCKELHILPQHYLVLKDRLIKEAVTNGYITQGVARNVLKVDVHCTDRVLHFSISQHIVPPITKLL